MTQLHLFPLSDQQSSGPQPSPKNEEAIDKKARSGDRAS